MATVTLKINEKTKEGKTLMSLLEFFISEKKGVELLQTPNFETLKAMYEAKNKISITRTKNTEDLFKKLDI
jgi:antitoxin component of RelBE/YafQ-DinJ toxin-antitoxin module